MSEDFFPPPPPVPDPEPQPPAPPWAGPPHSVLPGAVAIELVVAQNERAAVYVGRCSAYRTGFELELRVLTVADAAELDPSLSGIYRRPGRRSSYEEMLRFGIAFADGRRVSNVGGHGRQSEEPEGAVLRGMGGSGGAGRWSQDFWVWPLPPPGPLSLVCEWPAAGIPLTRVTTEAELLLNAAARSKALFPNLAPSGPGSTWSSTSMQQHLRRP